MNVNWVQLLVLVIPILVWIIASLIGSMQQNGPRTRGSSRTAQPPAAAKEETPEEALKVSEEQERKLEEARKRRKQQADRQSEVERRRQVESDQARRRSTPAAEPKPVPQPATRRADPKPAPEMPFPRERERDRERDKPVAVPRVEKAPVALPTSRMDLPAAPVQTALVQSLGEAAQVKREPLSPIALEIRRLLQSPVSVGAAFVLREIFDPPPAMRKRK